MSEWGLVLSFSGLDYGKNTEHAFVHGFEVGQIWERMKSGREAEIEATVHSINDEVFRRAAAADGWNIEITPSDADGVAVPGWSDVKLTKTPGGPQPERAACGQGEIGAAGACRMRNGRDCKQIEDANRS